MSVNRPQDQKRQISVVLPAGIVQKNGTGKKFPQLFTANFPSEFHKALQTKHNPLILKGYLTLQGFGTVFALAQSSPSVS